MRQLLLCFSLLLLFSLMTGCSGQKDIAYDFVTKELQAKQDLFSDQYDLDMALDNNRGTLVIAEIIDEGLIKDGKKKYLAYILTKRQDNPSRYRSNYTTLFLKEEPTDEKIDSIAKEYRLQ